MLQAKGLHQYYESVANNFQIIQFMAQLNPCKGLSGKEGEDGRKYGRREC